eukprot:1143708-Pelagomonas_calceolata.AAC.4
MSPSARSQASPTRSKVKLQGREIRVSGARHALTRQANKHSKQGAQQRLGEPFELSECAHSIDALQNPLYLLASPSCPSSVS